MGRLIDDCVLPLYDMGLSEKGKVCIRGLMLFCPEKNAHDPEMKNIPNFYQEQLMSELEEESTIHHRRCKAKPLRQTASAHVISAGRWS